VSRYRSDDTQEEFSDAIKITHGKSGEVVLIYRPHILWFSERTRVIKESCRRLTGRGRDPTSARYWGGVGGIGGVGGVGAAGALFALLMS
jgi:hypothetical protein